MTNHRHPRLWPALAMVVSISFTLSACSGARAPASSAEVDGSATPNEPLRNTIRWATASEVDTFGYDVYRSACDDTEFERVTADPILGARSTDDTTRYQWVDATIEPGREYCYYVERITLEGVREPFTPVLRAPAKGSTDVD